MPCKTKLKLIQLAIPILYLIILINYTEAVTIQPSTYFMLSTHSTYIDFQNNEEFTEITVESNYVLFDDYRLNVENGNVTFINWFNDDTLSFSTSWTTGGKTIIYMNGSTPIQTPYKITYLSTAPAWYWIGTNNTLKLEVTNPDTIEIFWIGEDEPIPPSPPAPEPEPIIPSPIIIPSEQVPEIVVPSPKNLQELVKVVYPYAAYIYLGALAIVSTISLTFLYGKTKKGFKRVLGGSYNPHSKRTNYHKPKRGTVDLRIKKTKHVTLKVKKKKMPKLKEKDLYD